MGAISGHEMRWTRKNSKTSFAQQGNTMRYSLSAVDGEAFTTPTNDDRIKNRGPMRSKLIFFNKMRP